MAMIRGFLAALVLSVAMTVVGVIAGVPADTAWADAPTLLGLILEGLATTASACFAHPKAALIITGVVVTPILLGRLISLIPRRIQKDPQRMFTSAQRKSGFGRAGGRCEMEGVFYTRCRKPAQHGDHWFPWSKGGPTDMDNFVAGCIQCNCSKGSKIPTFWQTQRLVFRRRRYFPEYMNSTPGGKFEIPNR